MIYQKLIEVNREDNIVITSPKHIYQLLEEHKNALQEYFFLITMRNIRPIGVYIVTIGILDKAIIHSREVFCRAILDCSDGIIIAHNHPSGNAFPSKEDILITRRLYKAGNIIGIRVADHIIITDKGYYSFRENNIIFKNDKNKHNDQNKRGEIKL